ncbi:MAG: bifunctional glutamate N-acetyltransferase/amino-acid acetyltransferase ArgJ [Acidobacteria bacterium]|nr:bifunctional glutamate N-acetyltransferase/amino-acid acetyltransferase ArgJ [Acidobacteriota bacterium]
MSILLPAGYRAGAAACGLKRTGDADVALIVSGGPASAAGVFTTNRVQAAPIGVTKRHLRAGNARAIVANAGNANACTGARGRADATETAEVAARCMGIRRKDVLVASTGIIGHYLPMDRLRDGVTAAAAALSSDGLEAAARAIMTTDTRPKLAEATAGGGARVVGLAKGAGMIAPEMATMLGFILTDAACDRGFLSAALTRAVRASFNRVSVDGCRSTNDTVLLLANGAAGGPLVVPGTPEAEAVQDGIDSVCVSLARQIVEDGEGATKVVTVRVRGAANDREARAAARAIVDSVLLRAALNAADPNWGRVMAAVGVSGIALDPNAVDVWLGGQKLCERGAPGPGDLSRAAEALRARDVEIVVDLSRGSAECVFLTNDLSTEYVRLNAEYPT